MRRFFLMIISLIILLVCALISYWAYIPRFFWDTVYQKNFSEADRLAETLGNNRTLDRYIHCWEADNSRCGIVVKFTTTLSLSEFKEKIDALGYENKLTKEIEGTSLFGILTDNGRSFSYKGEQYSTLQPPRDYFWNTTHGISYWLINNQGKSLDISYFELPKEPLLLDGVLLNDSVMELILYIRGR